MRRRHGGGCGLTYGGVAQENSPSFVVLLLLQSVHRSSRDNVAVCVVLETFLALHNATRKVLTSEVNVGPQHIFPRRFAFTALAPSSWRCKCCSARSGNSGFAAKFSCQVFHVFFCRELFDVVHLYFHFLSSVVSGPVGWTGKWASEYTWTCDWTGKWIGKSV